MDDVAGPGRAHPEPEGRDHDPLRRQVRRIRGLLQEHQRGAVPRRVPPPAEGEAEVHRGRSARTAGRAAPARRRRRHPGGAGLRRPRQPRHDGRRRVRPHQAHPLLRHLLRVPVGGGRVRAERRRARRRRLDRSRRERRAQGHLQAARPARRRRHGRHDAARQLRLPARAGLARVPASTARRSSTSAIGIATSSTASTRRPSPTTGCGSSAARSTASSSRSSSSRDTRGSWRCSSTPSSSRSRCARIRCSRASSRPPTSGRWRSQGLSPNVTAIGERRRR